MDGWMGRSGNPQAPSRKNRATRNPQPATWNLTPGTSNRLPSPQPPADCRLSSPIRHSAFSVRHSTFPPSWLPADCRHSSPHPPRITLALSVPVVNHCGKAGYAFLMCLAPYFLLLYRCPHVKCQDLIPISFFQGIPDHGSDQRPALLGPVLWGEGLWIHEDAYLACLYPEILV